MAAEGQSDRMVSDMEVRMKQRCVIEFLRRKNGTHSHLLMLAECLWKPNSGCEHSEAVGDVFQQRQQRRWVTFDGVVFYECGMQACVHHEQKR